MSRRLPAAAYAAARALCARALPLLALLASSASAQDLRPGLPVTDGVVHATAVSDDGRTVYLGGTFSYLGPATGNGAVLDPATGALAPAFPAVDGPVLAAVPDGAGGFYIGGDFTSVGGLPRLGLARILADGTVDAGFRADADETVRALAVRGGTVYVGGHFTSIGGQARRSLAAVDATTGAVDLGFQNSAPFEVRALAVSGAVLYVGGSFSTIGGVARASLAALDATTGAVNLGFQADVDRSVNSLAIAAGRLYVGGQYESIGGSAHTNVAVVDAGTGAVDPGFRLDANHIVFALAVRGATLYVGGVFGILDDGTGPAATGPLVAVDAASGAVDAGFAPGIDGRGGRLIRSLAVNGGTLFVGGEFSTFESGAGPVTRIRLAALDAVTGAADPAFQANANDEVRALAVSGSTLFAGGRFASIGGAARNHLAALNAATGAVESGFLADTDDSVFALAVGGGRLYAGGRFGSVDSGTGPVARERLAAVDAATGALVTGFRADTDNFVQALTASGNRLYVGGAFRTIDSGSGAVSRLRLAALDAGTGAVDAGFRADADRPVEALAVHGTRLYVGGQFVSIDSGAGPVARLRFGALEAATGAVDTGFRADISGGGRSRIMTLAAAQGRIFVGGDFTAIDDGAGPVPRLRLAAVGAATGGLDPDFLADADGRVQAVAVNGPTVYVGGNFQSLDDGAGPVPRLRLAALDAATGDVDPAFLADLDGSVNTLAVGGGALWLGGAFSEIAGEPRRNVAALEVDEVGGPIAVVTLTNSNNPLEEGGDPSQIIATLSAPVSGDVVLTLAFGGDATGPTTTVDRAVAGDRDDVHDYDITDDDLATEGVQIVVPSGATSGSVSLTARADGLDEPNEHVVVTIAAIAGNAEDPDPAESETLYIADGDPTLVALSVDPGSVAEDGETTATLTATLTSPAQGDVVVALDLDGEDDVTIADDGTSTANQITIPNGATTGTATLTAVDDLGAEADEEVTVAIAGVTGAGWGPASADPHQASVAVTVVDDGDVNVSFAVVQRGVGEGVGSVDLVVDVTPRSDAAFDVTVTLVSGDPADLGGFTAATFAVGPATSGPYAVTVPITDDARPEPTETFFFELSVQPAAETPSVTVSDPSRMALLVVDNDGEAVTVTVPASGPTAFAVPVNGVTAGEVAAAAGADAVFVVGPDGALVAADPARVLAAGDLVVVDATGDVEFTGSAPAATVAPALVPVRPGDSFRVLVPLGNPTDGPVALSSRTVEGGTLADVVLVFDPAAGAFVPVSLAGAGCCDASSPKLRRFEAVILQVVPTGDPADVAVSLDVSADPGASAGPSLGDAAFAPSEGETAVVLTLQPSTAGADAERLLAASPGDTAALRFLSGGADGDDPFDGADVPSPLGATLAVDGDYPLAALALAPLTAGAARLIPLVVSAPAGTYELDAETSAELVGNRPVVVELLDNGVAQPLGNGPVTIAATGVDGEFDGRFAVRVSLGAGVAAEDGPEAGALAVFPNPAVGRATVRLTGVTGHARVAVYDVLGREVAVVLDGPVAGSADATVDGLAPGMYSVRLATEAGVAVRSLTVVR